jgi:hypothetical protein
VKESKITAERKNKQVPRNATVFKKIERNEEYDDDSEEEDDEYYCDTNQDDNFPNQQVEIQIEPENQQGYVEQDSPNDFPGAVIRPPNEETEGQHEQETESHDQDIGPQEIANKAKRICQRTNRTRLIEALVRNPPPNELVRPTRATPDEQPPEESTSPKRNIQPPKYLEGFQVNLFYSKKRKVNVV